MSNCLRSWEFFAATTKNISCVVIRFFWNSKRVVCVFSALRHMCNLVAMIIGHWWWVGRRLLAIHQRSSHPLDRMEIGIIGIVIVITFWLHLTSSSDQLDRLENSLALEMVLVKRIWWKELGRKRGFVLGMFYLFKRFASHRFSFHWQLWPKFTRKECWNWKWKPKTDQKIFCYHHKMKCIVKQIIMIVFLFMMVMMMTVCLLMMMTMILCLFMKVDCQCGSSLLRVDPVVGRRL